MAYNTDLADRIAICLHELGQDFSEKKMFGGLAFMMDDKMCVGVVKDEIMLRVLDDVYEDLLHENHVKPMQFTGKTMKGFLFLEAGAFERQDDLIRWLNHGIDFRKHGVVKSKKKKS